MGMLDRYYKSGGFLQLLNLIETCGPAKQEKFLTMIREEDSRWADAIETKTLSIKKIMSWNQDALAEVMGALQDLTIAVMLHGLDTETREKIYKTFSHGQKRKIDELFTTSTPTPAEINAMYMKVIVEVRKMITDGRLRMDKVDPNLTIADDIEEQLKKIPKTESGSNNLVMTSEGTTLNFDKADLLGSPQAPSSSGGEGPGREEVILLKRRVATLSQENNSLKSEVTTLRQKLDQIRKAVA